MTPGNYTADLTVTNGILSDSMIKTITVIQPITPVANFISNSKIGSQPLSIAFTDTSTGSPTSWTWDFGDGDTSTNQNPVHEYSNNGNYSVTLTVANGNGSNHIQKANYVRVLPYVITLPQSLSANFSLNIISGDTPLTVQFNDMSTGSPTSWNWDFGDGYTSTEQNPTHTYFSSGTFNVNLIASNVNGNDSKVATITVQSSSDGGSRGGSSHSDDGGGPGGSPEPQSNVEVKEISQAFISSGNSVKFNFPQKVTHVVYVSFDSKKTAGKTTTIVEMLKNKSTLVSEVPADEVYKYLNIWVGNSGYATDKNIENAVIGFKVAKSWVQDRNINKSTITLNRYNDKIWNQLPTTLSSEDDNYLYFTAKASGFSEFAITGKITSTATVQPATGNKTPSIVDNTQNNTGNKTVNIDQTHEITKSTNTSGKEGIKTPDFEVSSGIVCLLSVFLYKKR
jgi:PGF-pre-PGF domain-containing protein